MSSPTTSFASCSFSICSGSCTPPVRGAAPAWQVLRIASNRTSCAGIFRRRGLVAHRIARARLPQFIYRSGRYRGHPARSGIHISGCPRRTIRVQTAHPALAKRALAKISGSCRNRLRWRPSVVDQGSVSGRRTRLLHALFLLLPGGHTAGRHLAEQGLVSLLLFEGLRAVLSWNAADRRAGTSAGHFLFHGRCDSSSVPHRQRCCSKDKLANCQRPLVHRHLSIHAGLGRIRKGPRIKNCPDSWHHLDASTRARCARDRLLRTISSHADPRSWP